MAAASVRQILEEAWPEGEQRWEFRVVGETVPSGPYGDEEIVLAGHGVASLVLKDRGRFFVDVGPKDRSSWFNLARLLEYFGIGGEESYSAGEARHEQAESLRRQLLALETLLPRVESLFAADGAGKSAWWN